MAKGWSPNPTAMARKFLKVYGEKLGYDRVETVDGAIVTLNNDGSTKVEREV